MVYALDINANNFAPAKFTNVASILNILLPVLTTGAALVFLVMMIWGGIRWIRSGDNAEETMAVRKTFMFAVIGLMIVIISFFVVKFIAMILGIGQLPL